MSWWTAREGALVAAARARLLVLDVDGVLLDPRPSFYRAASETAAWAAARALGRPPAHTIDDGVIAAFKAAGGWNDDFDLAFGCAWTLVLAEAGRSAHSPAAAASRCGGGLPALRALVEDELEHPHLDRLAAELDLARVRERCAARYAGRARCHAMYRIDAASHPDLPEQGLWSEEPILCDPLPLKRSPYELAFFTGRNGPEAELAIERLGLVVPPANRIVDDGHVPRKPAPDGLLRLSAAGGAMLYVGDSIDDQHAALAYRTLRPDGPRLVFARVLGPDASSQERGAAVRAGADVVVAGLDSLLAAISEHRKD